MKSHEQYDYCVVGAGPSGLTISYKLLQAGKKVLLIERDPRIGGLAKSYNYDGHIFDTGPKRFHTDDPEVLEFIHEVSDSEILRIGRSTKVYFLGKYFEWPLKSSDLFKMPFHVSFRCFLDLIQKRAVTDPTSFHQYVNAKYGETLYRTFFEPYTHKFLRWDVDDIHSDWASTGINRTVIDKRVSTNNLLDIFKTLLLPPKIETEFLYPKAEGFGGFYEKLFGLCQTFEKFQFILNDKINGLEDMETHFCAFSEKMATLSFKELIWSGNLNDLNRLVKATEGLSGQDSSPEKSFSIAMPYLNTIFYNIICRQEGIGAKKAQWIYVSKGNSLISRITCMKEFAPYSCKRGYYNVICELTDSQREPQYFSRPEQYSSEILNELTSMDFLKDKSFVEDVKINTVVDTYPIYYKRYITDFVKVRNGIRKFSTRIHLLGRSGGFWYNNSDHSIRFAIELAKQLLEGGSKDFDFREYFGGQLGEPRLDLPDSGGASPQSNELSSCQK